MARARGLCPGAANETVTRTGRKIMRRALMYSLALGLVPVSGSTLVSGDRIEAAEHLAAGGSGLDAKVFIQSNA
jgi:hypothetical protein